MADFTENCAHLCMQSYRKAKRGEAKQHLHKSSCVSLYQAGLCRGLLHNLTRLLAGAASF